MLLVFRKNISRLRYPLYASLTLSFVSLGDAFLYPFLPQFAHSMYIPVAFVGFLLSINRFVRIVINPVVVSLFARYGVRQPTIFAALIAILTTIGYGLGLELFFLIVFRIFWGIAFSILRMSTLAYAFEHEKIGFSLGTSRSIQELGPMFALLAGPVLLSYFSPGITFFYLAIFSLPGLFYAIKLPDLEYKRSVGSTRLFQPFSVPDAVTLLVTFTVEGLLIIAIGMFIAKNDVNLTGWMITTLSAGYLAYRRICFVLFSPLGGILADRIGLHSVFNTSLFLICLGLIALLMGWYATGLIMIFTFNSVLTAIGPAAASENRRDRLTAVSANATWRDLGAATGTLAGGLLLETGFLTNAFIIATFILVTLLLINLRTIKLR